MPQVDLTDKEWQALLGVLAQAPWHIANPLLIRIAQQLQLQQPPAQNGPDPEEIIAAERKHS